MKLNLQDFGDSRFALPIGTAEVAEHFGHEVPHVFPGPQLSTQPSANRIRYHAGLRALRRIRNTPLGDGCELIAAKNPWAASVLEDFHDQVVLTHTRMHETLEARLTTERKAANDRAEQCNRPLDAEIWRLEEIIDASVVETQKQQADLVPRLMRTELVAASLIGRAGFRYDPDDPLAAILPEQAASLEEIAGLANLPYDPSDASLGSNGILDWALAAISGAALGISGGLASGILDPSTLTSQVPLVIGWAAAGFALAVYLKRGIGRIWAHCGQQMDLDTGDTHHYTAGIVATFATAAVMATNTLVDSQGLMAVRGMNSAIAGLSGNATAGSADIWASSAAVLIATGALFSVPFLLSTAVEGYARGRHTRVRQILLMRQKAAAEERNQRERGRQSVQEALVAANLLTALRSEEENLQRRQDRLAATLTHRIDELKSKRQPIHLQASAEDWERLSLTEQQAIGMHAEFRKMLAEIGNEIEPSRFWDHVGSSRHISHTRHEWWDHFMSTRLNDARTVVFKAALAALLVALVAVVVFALSRFR